MPPHFHTDWFSKNIPVWERVLQEFRGKPYLQFLEIGSFEGRSACWFLETILTDPTSMLTCIDLFTVNEGGRNYVKSISPDFPDDFDMERAFTANIKAVGGESRVTMLKGKSSVLLRYLPLHSYECIYIDGSHGAVDVLTDAVLCWDLLRDGGILIFDDYELKFGDGPLWNPGIAIDVFLQIYEGRYELLHRGWQIILRKKKLG